MQSNVIEGIVWGRIFLVMLAIVMAIIAAFRISHKYKTVWPLVLLGTLGALVMFGAITASRVIVTPPHMAGPVAIQTYGGEAPIPPMAPMAPMGPMGPGAMKMPNGHGVWEGGMGTMESGHPVESTVNLVADPSAWRPEVEELYRANLYSSVPSAARSLGQRLRQQLAKLPESERPKRVYVVSPEGRGDAGTTTTVQLAASEIARQLRQLNQLDVQLIPSARSVREEWDAAATKAKSLAAAATAAPPATEPDAPAEVTTETPTEAPADRQNSEEEPTTGDSAADLSGAEHEQTPVTPAPPAPEDDPSTSSDTQPSDAEPSDGEVGDGGAEVSRPVDVASLTSGAEPSESPSDLAVSVVPYLVEVDLVEYSVQTPGNWGMNATSQGALRASLESPGTLYDQQVRFYDKPWVDREDEFVARNPRGNFVVVRSELMVSPEEARQQNQQLLGDYLYQRMMSANQLNPGLVQPHQLMECEALQSLIQDRFVQQLDGPAGEPVWREALLVRAGAPGEPNALTQWVQERQMAQQVVQHHEQVRRRSVGAQMVVILGGIAGLYTMLNAATQGYFTGRLRAVAVVAVVLALLGFLMIS
ncbi:MAG: hypothetical protein U0795_18355 [Pirellulales bacterium]